MPSRRRNAPSVPASLHRSASASNRRFSLPENLRRLAIATTSGSRRAASGETVSPVALRAPSATASPEEPDNPFKEDLNNEVMCMSYLYSKLPETGVPLLIGTGGLRIGDFESLGIFLFVSSARTVRPASVVVAAMSSTIVRKLRKGLPRQLMLMKEKSRCSILFHLLVPGGKWHTVTGNLSSSASFCSSIFHRRTR